MKKFTLMLASLLLSAGSALADQLIADGIYQLNVDLNSQRGQVVAADGYDYPVLDGITLSGYTGNSTTAMDNGKYYYVKTTEVGTYFYNVAKSAFIASEDGVVNFSTTLSGYWTVSSNSSNSGYYNILDSTTGKYLSGGCGRTAANRPIAFDTNSNDGGALFTFGVLDEGTTTYADAVTAAETAIASFEETLVVPEYLTSIADLSNTKAFAISTASRGSWYAQEAQLNGTGEVGVSADSTSPYQQFAFLRGDNTAEGEYYLYSVGQSKFISKSGNYTTLTESPVQTVKLLDSSNSSYPWVVAFVGESDVHHIGVSSYYSPDIITFYNDLTDGGNQVSMLLCEKEFDSANAVEAINIIENKEIQVTYNFTYGGEVKYTQTSKGYIDSEWPTITVTLPLGVIATIPEGTIASTDVTDGIATKSIEMTIGTLPFQYAESFDTIEHWYYLNIHANGYYLYYEADATSIALTQTSVPEDFESQHPYTWAFVGDPFTGYQIVNYAAGSTMILSSTTSTSDGNTGGSTYPIMVATPVADDYNTYWIFTESTNRTNGFYIAQAGYPSNRMNNRDSKLAYWTGGADGGSTFVVEERNMDEVEAAIADAEEVIATAKQYVIGTGVGTYTESGSESVASLLVALQAAVGAASDASTIKSATKSLSNALSTLSLNMPEAGKFYRIQCVASEKYLNGNVSSDRIPMLEDANANMAESVFYYDGTYLVAWQDGKVLGQFIGNDQANSWKTVLSTNSKAGTVIFDAVSAIGKYSIQASTGRYIYGANANVDCGGSAGDEGYYWTLSEVQWLPLVGSDKELTAVYCPVPLNAKDNVSVYSASISGSLVPTTKIDGGIPSNTTVLVKFADEVERDANTELVYLELNYNAVATLADEEETTSALSGGLYAIAAEDSTSYFTAQNRENTYTDSEGNEQTETVVDFCAYEGTEIPGFVAYIAVAADDVPEAGYYEISGEGATTGIEEILAEGAQAGKVGIYDLQGRCLSAPAKGINIINGKKILVK